MGSSILARNILLLDALANIGARAAAAGCDVIALKGAALLAEGAYGPGEREMTDVDLLVRPGDHTAMENVLAVSGFRPMENSSQAYYRMVSPGTPPLIIDLHTDLWHLRAVGLVWGGAFKPYTEAPFLVLGLGEQVLHIASHTLLGHGYLGDRTLEDLKRLAEYSVGTGNGRVWGKAAALAAEYGLRPVVYPVLKRLFMRSNSAITAQELTAFYPDGNIERFKSGFFERAAVGHTNALEYMLPILHRPGLLMAYLFPDRRFLARRYGKDSWSNRLRRPFQLLASILTKKD